MSLNFDQKVALGGIATYFALVVGYVPLAGYPRMIGGGLVVFGALVALARGLGPRATPTGSVLAVSFAAAAILVVPAFPAMGGTRMIEIPIGFFGSQAAALLWIALRWRASDPGERSSLGTMVTGGVLAGLALCALATIPMLLAIASDEVPGRTLWLLYLGYLCGTLGAAMAYWLLQSIAHYLVGRYLIGLLGGICVYGAIAPVVFLMEGDSIDFVTLAGGALILGSLVGPPVALALIDAPAP